MGIFWFFQHCISLYKYMAWWHSAEQYLCEINIAKNDVQLNTSYNTACLSQQSWHTTCSTFLPLCAYTGSCLRVSHHSLCLLCLQPWSSPSVCRFLPTFAPETLWGTTPSLQGGAPSISVSVKTGIVNSRMLHSVLFFIPYSCIVSSYRWHIQLKANPTADPCGDPDTVQGCIQNFQHCPHWWSCPVCRVCCGWQGCLSGLCENCQMQVH